ncbi:MAG: alpha/beta hydrolase [Anaerolineales bacterium]
MRKTLCICFLNLLVMSCVIWDQAPSTIAPTLIPASPTVESAVPSVSFDPARLGSQEVDITYCTVDGVELKLDLYFPETLDETWPVAVYVHGGAWQGGDKTEGAGYREVPEMVARGYLVASLNYRLAPQYRFPAMIEDVKCAIRHLRANAATYNLDPQRIGAWGSSAGGHLVALLGVTDPNDGLEGQGGYPEFSSRVQAVADLFGPTDIRLGTDAFSTLERVFGTSDTSAPILEIASPVIYASADDPPFLILHGTLDPVVPSEHSQALYNALTQVGVPATLVMVENAGHGFARTNGPITPSRDEISTMIGDFFDTYLK